MPAATPLEQADFAEEKRQRQRELDRRQWRHLSAEKLKLGRLAAIGLAAGPDNKVGLASRG